MIHNARAQDDLYRLIRHTENKMETGSTFEDALASLRAVASIDNRKIDFLEGLIQGEIAGNAQLTPYKMASLETMEKLLNAVSRLGGEPMQSLSALKACLRIGQHAADQMLKGVKTLSVYLSVMLSLAIVCSTIYLVKILPQFESLFLSMNYNLPAFTQSALKVGEFLNAWWLFLIPVLIFLFYQLFQIGNRVSALEPMTGSLRLLPGLSNLRRTHFKYLVTNFAYVLVKGGLSGQEALEQAAMMATGKEQDKSLALLEKNGLFTDMLIARELDTLEPELDHAVYDVEHEYLSHLGSLREKILLSLQIMMALIIGAIVIAMYLPIFQIGQVV